MTLPVAESAVSWRLIQRREWAGDIVAAIAGGASLLAFAPFAVWPLAIVSPALLFALWVGVAPKRAAWRGFLYGAAEFLGGIYWIYTSVSGIGPAPWWLGTLLYILLALACAAFPALLGYVTVRLFRPGWPWLLLVPAAWALLEWIRSFLLTGFPWLALGFSQATTPLGGYGPALGTYGVSLVCVGAAVLLLLVLMPGGRWLARAGAALGIAAIFGLGAGLAGIAWVHPVGGAFRISLVQGNIAQTVKWQPDMLAPTLDRYARLTRAHWASRLVVWPEAAVPVWFSQVEPFLSQLADEAHRHHTTLVVGAPIYDFKNRASYNAVLALGAPLSVYYKRHLVPFGEYFPVPRWIKQWLSAHRLPYSSFTPGPWVQPPLTVGPWKAAVVNCYEVAFGRLLITQLPAAQFILNLSDDGWFGETIALAQQFQMAQMAARETGRFLAAATDNGITGIIAPDGRVVSSLAIGKVGVLTGEIRAYDGATPYVRWGNRMLVGIALGLLFVVLLILAARRYRPSRNFR